MIARLLLVIAITSVFLLGCAQPPKERIVYDTKTVLITPPDNLMMHQSAPAPGFTPVQYATASAEEREDFLDELNQKLYKTLEETNTRLKLLREWVQKNITIHGQQQQQQEVKNE